MFFEFLEACHRLVSRPVAIQMDQSLATKGSATSPVVRIWPSSYAPGIIGQPSNVFVLRRRDANIRVYDQQQAGFEMPDQWPCQTRIARIGEDLHILSTFDRLTFDDLEQGTRWIPWLLKTRRCWVNPMRADCVFLPPIIHDMQRPLMGWSGFRLSFHD